MLPVLVPHKFSLTTIFPCSYLYTTFASPWSEGPTTVQPEFRIPQCYFMTPPHLRVCATCTNSVVLVLFCSCLPRKHVLCAVSNVSKIPSRNSVLYFLFDASRCVAASCSPRIVCFAPPWFPARALWHDCCPCLACCTDTIVIGVFTRRKSCGSPARLGSNPQLRPRRMRRYACALRVARR